MTRANKTGRWDAARSVGLACLLSMGTACPSADGNAFIPERGVLEVTTASDVTFGYFEEGEGPLVLMIHGFPDTPHTWDRIRPAVARAGFRVVTPWLKGYTPSSAPAEVEAYQAEPMGQDIVELLDALGEQTAMIIGHDWGASASYSAVIQAPERWEKFVTVAIPHQGVSTDPLFLWRARHFVTLTWDDAEENFAAGDFASIGVLYRRWSPLWTIPDGEFDAVKNCYRDPAALRGALNYYRALWLDGPPAPFLEGPVEVPTLAFAGMSDGVVTEAMWDQTPAHFTSTYQLVKLSGGHWVHRENEAEFLAFLIPFLKGEPPPL